MPNILVINAGSSSIKYQLIDADLGTRLASGIIERIGEARSRVEHVIDVEGAGGSESAEGTERAEGAESAAGAGGVEAAGGAEKIEWEAEIPDHGAGFAAMIEAFARSGHPIETLGISAVGHRVVQGGSEFVHPARIDADVEEQIRKLSALAPLHNPGNLRAIHAARAALPEVPHVAVFDTAFHQTMPPAAYTYAIDPAVAEAHGVRRYGFHGVSHQVVSRRAARLLGRPVSELKIIVLHLGNGASACAIDRGRSIDTSMGLTPLEGLVMGTRSGDIDPGAMLHLLRDGMSDEELDTLLNKRSGLLGMAGSNDMRDVRARADAGDPSARLALEVYVHRLRHYLGAYLLELDGADAIVFTAGVGENSVPIRAEVCSGLSWFGIELDDSRNRSDERGARRISTDESRVAVLVVPTDEEAEIARQTVALLGG